MQHHSAFLTVNVAGTVTYMKNCCENQLKAWHLMLLTDMDTGTFFVSKKALIENTM